MSDYGLYRLNILLLLKTYSIHMFFLGLVHMGKEARERAACPFCWMSSVYDISFVQL